eukprot:CAMPEP_0183332946 /NCGR_PEP_ID=MMETSP0164_2-20130417/1993_1 /TAXON_ID=221442 /ORGANISM="Coccolithus pelagicus ssp braarudi, Strain PLY182g" /LENGTH=304 /DNA_ID=CAMNT_0025501767 /DNA_START=12 /DNA_END=926 /DNA_ORIENTATION=-
MAQNAAFNADPMHVQRKLVELEARVPWQSVKKAWTTRRQSWLSAVSTSTDSDSLARLLLRLEQALKQDVFASSWPTHAESWRAQLHTEQQTCANVEEALEQLQLHIEWERILLAPDLNGVPVPSQLDETLEGPPDGLPQVAARMLLLLRSMGVRKFTPGVVVQLLEVMRCYTVDVLNDASSCARFRTMGDAPAGESRTRQHGRPPPAHFKSFDEHSPHAQTGSAATIEMRDLVLAVETCTRTAFTTPPPREVMAQGTVECNLQPLDLLPRVGTVRLPEHARLPTDSDEMDVTSSLDDESLPFTW